MKKVLLVSMLLLSGCASMFDGPPVDRDELIAHIRLVDDSELPRGKGGDALCGNGKCEIRIRRSTYPYCITHEIMHGFSPSFHAGKDSDEYCYVRD